MKDPQRIDKGPAGYAGCMLNPSDQNLIVTELYFERRKGARRGALYILPGQVEMTIMACAPDMTDVWTVLHCTGKVRARCRKGTEFTLRSVDQYDGLASE